MNVNDAFPSKWLRAKDMEDDSVLTIDRIEIENMEQDNKSVPTPVLYFREVEKGKTTN